MFKNQKHIGNYNHGLRFVKGTGKFFLVGGNRVTGAVSGQSFSLCSKTRPTGVELGHSCFFDSGFLGDSDAVFAFLVLLWQDELLDLLA